MQLREQLIDKLDLKAFDYPAPGFYFYNKTSLSNTNMNSLAII